MFKILLSNLGKASIIFHELYLILKLAIKKTFNTRYLVLIVNAWPIVLLTVLVLIIQPVIPIHGQTPLFPGYYAVLQEPEVVIGPSIDAVDISFFTFKNGSTLYSYSGINNSVLYQGTNLNNLVKTSTIAIDKDYTSTTKFDNCGAWLSKVLQMDQEIIGFYHGETVDTLDNTCDYGDNNSNDFDTLWSIAYAESSDGGQTFQKPNHPNNQIITSKTGLPLTQQGVGVPSFIVKDDYIYSYYLDRIDWKIHLARASTASLGKPGNWFKWYQGGFTEPGLGGNSEPVANFNQLKSSWVSYNNYLSKYIGIGAVDNKSYSQAVWGYAGLSLSESIDGINWDYYNDVVLPSLDFDNFSQIGSNEILSYYSIIGLNGDNEVSGKSFYVYYMYINKGEVNSQRYLVRRLVTMEKTNSVLQTENTSRQILRNYQYGADTRSTTVNTFTRYIPGGMLGYIFTDEFTNSRAIYECYLTDWQEYMVSQDIGCENNPGSLKARLGFVSTTPFSNSIELYRCFDSVNRNHFLSNYSFCDGYTNEQLLGYIKNLNLETVTPLTPDDLLSGSIPFSCGSSNFVSLNSSPSGVGNTIYNTPFSFLSTAVPTTTCTGVLPPNTTLDAANPLTLKIGNIGEEDTINNSFDLTTANRLQSDTCTISSGSTQGSGSGGTTPITCTNVPVGSLTGGSTIFAKLGTSTATTNYGIFLDSLKKTNVYSSETFSDGNITFLKGITGTISAYNNVLHKDWRTGVSGNETRIVLNNFKSYRDIIPGTTTSSQTNNGTLTNPSYICRIGVRASGSVGNYINLINDTNGNGSIDSSETSLDIPYNNTNNNCQTLFTNQNFLIDNTPPNNDPTTSVLNPNSGGQPNITPSLAKNYNWEVKIDVLDMSLATTAGDSSTVPIVASFNNSVGFKFAAIIPGG